MLLLKDWDLPLYVEHGVADLGIVGSDVLAEVDGDLLVPARLRDGALPPVADRPRGQRAAAGQPGAAGDQVPERGAARWWRRARGAPRSCALSGSIELAPLLRLAEIALDIVQTGRTLAENRLVELEVVEDLHPCLVVQPRVVPAPPRAAQRAGAPPGGEGGGAYERALP